MSTRTAPAQFRKAARIANEIAMSAGELVNSITDGEQVTIADVRGLTDQLIKVNTKRKSIVDASTAAFFFDAAEHFGKASDAIRRGDLDTASEQLDLGANEMDQVEIHVAGLFA